MSHLLKRTKKSCLKLIRKISSKQIYLKRLEEEVATPRNEGCSDHSKDESYENAYNDEVKEKLFSLPVYLKLSQKQSSIALDEEEVNEDSEDCDCISKHYDENYNSTRKIRNNTESESNDFETLSHLCTENASEIIEIKRDPADKGVKKDIQSKDDDTQLDTVFEKVHYKQNVRYLRHTPSSTSLDNNNLICVADDECVDENFRTCTISPIINNNDDSLRTHSNQISSYTGKHQNNFFLPVNVSLGSKRVGNYQQLVITEEPDYFLKMTAVVKWDINGNSLEEEETIWNNYEEHKNHHHQVSSHWGGNRECSLNDSPKSSFYSSSTTIDTWLEEDDDAIDSMLLSEQQQQCCSSYKNRCLIK
uniref:Uncharacterized protein n=1 Tax=Glossina brevipalpis TaxID=37001 RepID=A0A1A9X3N8_9MUSC